MTKQSSQAKESDTVTRGQGAFIQFLYDAHESMISWALNDCIASVAFELTKQLAEVQRPLW